MFYWPNDVFSEEELPPALKREPCSWFVGFIFSRAERAGEEMEMQQQPVVAHIPETSLSNSNSNFI